MVPFISENPGGGGDSSLPGSQLAVLLHLQLIYYIDIYYRLGQNHLIINKYAVHSRYSSWPIKLVKD